MSGEIPPPSPCVGVCAIDRGTGLCVGCQRTSQEISRWPSYSAEEKRAVLAQLPARRKPDPEFDYEQFLK